MKRVKSIMQGLLAVGGFIVIMGADNGDVHQPYLQLLECIAIGFAMLFGAYLLED